MTGAVLATAVNAGVMGELVSVVPAVGDPYEVNGIFDAEHEAAFPSVDTALTTTLPVVSVRESDLPAPIVAGDRLTVRAQLYAVVDVHTDGQGTSDLVLNEVDA